MAKEKTANATQTTTATVELTVVKPKKGSVRFDAAAEVKEPILSNVYLDKLAAYKAGVQDLEKCKGVRITVEFLTALLLAVLALALLAAPTQAAAQQLTNDAVHMCMDSYEATTYPCDATVLLLYRVDKGGALHMRWYTTPQQAVDYLNENRQFISPVRLVSGATVHRVVELHQFDTWQYALATNNQLSKQ